VDGIPCITEAYSYRMSLGDMERSVSTRHDRFDLDSLFALQKCAMGQMAGVSIKKTSSVRQKWLRRSWAGVRLGACLEGNSQRDVIG
jgi:hypothetical protein